jgi:Xaa-Pro aminopeptidase
MPRRLALASLALVLLAAGSARADDTTAEFQARRARLLQALPPDTMAIFWSAPEREYSRDVEYEYRQDSDLLYLTGVAQPDTILVLMPGNRAKKEILFVRAPDTKREHWNGHSLTTEEATALTGIAAVHQTPAFERFLTSMLDRVSFDAKTRAAAVEDDEYSAYFDAVAEGRAKIALRLGATPGLRQPLDAEREFMRLARDRFVGVSFTNVSPAVFALRQVKTPYEQEVLRQSVAISAAAHLAGMKAARPGGYEHEVEAAIEQVYLARGAMSPGYPSIVGSGPNATVLHYQASTRKMEDGDLLLVDAAANYRGITGDITRTYPVNGRFSPAQRDIYALVLAVQNAGIAAARAGNRTLDIEKACEEAVKPGLLKLGLITDVKGDQFRTWYTHGVSHWIGMDVHDVGDYRRRLEPGMAFTIEPGVYIRPVALDQLPDTPENRAFKAAVAPAVEKYKNIGARIEDSFLLTSGGLEQLSKDVPRTIDEIEHLMGGR